MATVVPETSSTDSNQTGLVPPLHSQEDQHAPSEAQWLINMKKETEELGVPLPHLCRVGSEYDKILL